MNIVLLLLLNLFGLYNTFNYTYIDSQINISVVNFEEVYKKVNFYNDERIDEITRKVNKYLHSTLEGKGEFIVKYSIEKGVDPYLSASVILLETGCRWNCSKVVRNCNNVGGNVGKPKCGKGNYRKFDTLDDGIRFAINVLSNYYEKGKTTPEEIGPKYASSSTWPQKVNNYIKLLKKG